MSSDVVRRGHHYLLHGGRSVIPVGAHFVPAEGPDWPWRVGPETFDAAFAQMAARGLNAVRIDLLWSAIEPEPGRYDDDHLRRLDAIVEAARRHGLWLHPTLFIGGEVGDAYWDVPWRAERHPHADPEMRRLEAAQAAMLARRWRGDPAILGWDLTDEPPFWLFPETTDDDARAWTDGLATALREEDPDHLITIGTSGQEVGWGPFRADVVMPWLDFLCVHPYPIYQEDVYPDSLLSARMTLAAAFETTLAGGAGMPAMVHEYGASSAQFDPEAIGSYDRLLSWSSLGRGAIGYLAWCWTDADRSAFARVPYVRQPHETQFGVTERDGTLRPRGRVVAELAATVRRIDLDAYAADGPAQAAAALVVPHEWVRPYDPVAFGLDDGSSGRYVPVERTRDPRRDPRPLSRSWLNAFVMAARADVPVAFAREQPAGPWPDVRLLLLPAPLASTSSSLLHVRTDFWHGAPAFFERGGTLWLSCSADVAIAEMASIAGCHLADRAPLDLPPVLRFVRGWGPFREGDELALPVARDASLHTRGVRLALDGARVVAVDAEGRPALVIAERGPGRAITCAYPVELLLADSPDAHGPSDTTWGLYAGAADLAAARGLAWTGDPDVVTGTLLGPRGGVSVLTNHAPRPTEVPLHLEAEHRRMFRVTPEGEQDLPSGSVELDAHAGLVVAWET